MNAASQTRTIRLESMTRVEGEGGLRIEVRDGSLRDVKFDVFEAPRFFEAFLRSRLIREVRWASPQVRRFAACAVFSTAANGLKATLCTFTCCRLRTSLEWRAH